jgi:hypothetical protein
MGDINGEKGSLSEGMAHLDCSGKLPVSELSPLVNEYWSEYLQARIMKDCVRLYE